jgi:transposase-like protein
MAKHRNHSIEFKRQIAQEFVAGETLHGLAKRHDLSRNLIRIWVRKLCRRRAGLDDGLDAGNRTAAGQKLERHRPEAETPAPRQNRPTRQVCIGVE